MFKDAVAHMTSKYYSGICIKGQEYHENLMRIVDLRTEIRTWDLYNTKQRSYPLDAALQYVYHKNTGLRNMCECMELCFHSLIRLHGATIKHCDYSYLTFTCLHRDLIILRCTKPIGASP
jgi:hypothetical protein